MTDVREMRATETDVVSALLVLANEEHLRTFPAAVAAAYARELSDVQGRLTTCVVLVAERADQVVGSVTLVRDAGDDGHPWPPAGSVLRLLAVAPEARRTGLGRALTTACVARARSEGADYVGLHTAPSMTAARRLYEDIGFRRSPEHDFNPDSYYAGQRGPDEATWGLAYILPFTTSPRLT